MKKFRYRELSSLSLMIMAQDRSRFVQIWVQISALSFPYCVTLGKFLGFSFLIHKMRKRIVPTS